MRDFFARQELARRRTGQLLLLFALAVMFIIVCAYLVVRGVYLLHNLHGDNSSFWDTKHFLVISGAISMLIAVGSWYRIDQLREGGFRVAEMLGGRRIPSNTQIPDERRLLNVVEEMAIASGVPVPDTYVLDREGSINALVAGFGPDDVVICLTRGALHHLNRDELQGVVGHEFSHILNCDTAINIRMLGLLNGIYLISLTGEKLLRGRFAVLGIALHILGYLGVLLGSAIKSAISRQREYLADASAVQFTRNPAGLAGALKKIGGFAGSRRIAHPNALEASHMFFSSGVAPSWMVLSTHPPLFERILRLEPSFAGVFPEIRPVLAPPAVAVPERRKVARPKADGFKAVSGATAAAILQSVGTPMREHADKARTLLAGTPESLRAATRALPGACHLIYALLLARDPKVRARQMEIVQIEGVPANGEEIGMLADSLSGLSPQIRLPLMDLALPALRGLSMEEYLRFKEKVRQLSAADGRHSLFEFALEGALLRHLESHFRQTVRKIVQIYAVKGVDRECSCVLSLLARVGHREAKGALAAFNHGGRILREPGVDLEFLPVEECAPSRLTQALEALSATSPPIKRRVLAACLECLMHDQQIRVEEIELFRAVADALGCPVPPWLSIAEESSAQGARNAEA